MAKPPKPHAGGTWTDARKKSFIISALRSASQRWPPKHHVLKAARVGRGLYKCSVCETVGPPKLSPEKGKTRKRNNAVVDHIHPVVPVDTGFTTWDSFINNLFCEAHNLQVLCYECNKKKGAEEREHRKENKKHAN